MAALDRVTRSLTHAMASTTGAVGDGNDAGASDVGRRLIIADDNMYYRCGSRSSKSNAMGMHRLLSLVELHSLQEHALSGFSARTHTQSCLWPALSRVRSGAPLAHMRTVFCQVELGFAVELGFGMTCMTCVMCEHVQDLCLRRNQDRPQEAQVAPDTILRMSEVRSEMLIRQVLEEVPHPSHRRTLADYFGPKCLMGAFLSCQVGV